MDQNLSFQRYPHPPPREESFFACLNCFAQPEMAECYVDKQSLIKNAKQNYLYPSTITQDERLSVHSNHPNSMLQSRKSTNNIDSKKDAISLRRSRKINHTAGQTIVSQEVPSFLEKVCREETAYTPNSLLMQPNNSNLPSSRLSVQQSYTHNYNNQVPQTSTRTHTSRPSIAFSYKQSPPNLSAVTPNPQSSIKQNFPSGSPFNPTDSYLKNSQVFIQKNLQPTTEKLSQIYANKQILQSLQLGNKQGSSVSKESGKMKKNGNFGQGKLHFQVRQTVSIRQPEEQDVHESIVFSNTQFSQYSGPLNTLLKPITQSELQLQSFIGSNPRNR